MYATCVSHVRGAVAMLHDINEALPCLFGQCPDLRMLMTAMEVKMPP